MAQALPYVIKILLVAESKGAQNEYKPICFVTATIHGTYESQLNIM